jgi:hypothetical protein
MKNKEALVNYATKASLIGGPKRSQLVKISWP